MKAGVKDAAGVGGGVVAALCCAGNPVILAALAAVGLSFLKQDAILWPVMLLSLAVAVWGFWQGWSLHRDASPLVVGSIGAVSMAAGVIVVHGFPAMEMIHGGAGALVVAALLNVRARRRLAHKAIPSAGSGE
jgi:mercuric ion transport protein